jgi:sarcosine dehydrogenase
MLKKVYDIVIIGGGSIGTSIAYHLGKKGIKNVALLEKNKLTSGTTWHSAGLLWQLRPTDVEIKLISETRNIAKNELEAGWIETGGLFLSSTKNRMDEYQRLHNLGKVFNIESSIVDPKQIKEIHPLLDVNDLTGGLYVPGDGTIDPSTLVSSLAKGAKKNGIEIHEDITVKDLSRIENNNILVKTSNGNIETKDVVICGGSWSTFIKDLPQCTMHHAYIQTETVKDSIGKPCIRDHDLSIYIKQQGSVMAIGGYEKNPIIWDKIEENFAFSLFDLNYDVFEENFKGHIKRVPVIGSTGIKSTICGPESFTPDHKPLMGPLPGNPGIWVCSGFNSSGIMLAGGCGKQMADWIVDSYPSLDIFSYDISRFHTSLYNNNNWIKERSKESYEKNYSIYFSRDQPLVGRNQRKSAIHDILEGKCYFIERHGMEIPGYFLEKEIVDYKQQLDGDLTFDWPESHDIVKNEVLNCRENVCIFDQSSFGKIVLSGIDACKSLDWICTNNMDVPIGKTVYTAMCNHKGGVMCDLTVTRLAKDEYYIVTGGSTITHNLEWIKLQTKKFNVLINDVSDEYGVLSIQGPKSGDLLESISNVGTDPETNFPFSTHKKIKINDKEVDAIRLTFVGELGWELHIKYQDMKDIYETIIKKGSCFGIKNAGYRAIDSMSVEKKYHHWHEDLTLTDTPHEAGIGFVCKLNKDFIGRNAIIEQKKNGLIRKLLFFTCNIPLNGQEPIYKDGNIVGFVCRTAYGHSIKKTVLSAYINLDKLYNMKEIKELKLSTYQVLDHNNKLYELKIH